MSTYAGVDVGGTKILAGAVDRDGAVKARSRVATPKDAGAEEMTEAIADAVRQLASEVSIEGVGVGVAAYVNADRSRAMFAPHLPFRDYPLDEELQKRLDLPVVIENDANAAIWAESRFGVAAGVSELLGVTLGTGVGGGLVIGGHIQRGANGMGGEFGHIQMVPDGQLCKCGQRGCLEQYASGTALTRYGQELVTEKGRDAGMLFNLSGGDPSKVTGPMVSDAALAGDAEAVALFETLADWLGAGLASLTAALDPSLIVIGGGLVEVSQLYLERLRAVLAQNLTGRDYRRVPDIVPAQLGQDAGFLGAADLAATGG